MFLTVKYCGGCQASYDRVAMVERIRREFPGVAVTHAGGPDGRDGADLVLVVCGCAAVCAAHAGLDGRHGKILTACAGDFDKVREAIAGIRDSFTGT